VSPFPADQLAFLERHGFDAAAFARWRHDLAAGRLSPAGNAVRGRLEPPLPGDVRSLPEPDSAAGRALAERGRAAIGRGELGVVVLNGGMATRFGGVVKGVVDVQPGRSFLALRAGDLRRTERACGGRVPLFVMNSFATDEATRAHFAAHHQFGLDPRQVHHFEQFVSARLTPAGEVFRPAAGEISSYATGHGDFAPALRASGCLRRFLDGGGRVLFVANVDNLGARISPLLVGAHLEAGKEATVEVTQKRAGDVGGSPYRHEGRLQLVEQIRYPDGFDPSIVRVFNTNTFHFTAAALDRDFDLGWYYVEKKVDGRTAVQVERLIGELTRWLDTQFVEVGRTGPQGRFLPVKVPQDLVDARAEIAAMYPE
jgi:UTP--glucose-1-phosphate uridylyltransferase